MLELMEIKKGLMTLLSENERVTDLERLDRDEFVIDVKRKDQVFDEGEKECEEGPLPLHATAVAKKWPSTLRRRWKWRVVPVATLAMAM